MTPLSRSQGTRREIDRLGELSSLKILVTGGTGFIGTHLCNRLGALAANVHAVSRAGRPDGALRWWEGDLRDIIFTRRIFEAIKPDIVFHLAGLPVGNRSLEFVLPTFNSNLLTTVNLLTIATEFKCRRFVFAGSLEEPASSELTPCSPYAVSKWACSSYGKMFHSLYGSPIVNARIFMTYGPGQSDLQKLIPYVILSLLTGQAPRLSSGERLVDWIYVHDVVEGLLAAAVESKAVGATVDLGSGTLVSIRSVVEQIATIVASGTEFQFNAFADRPMEQVRVADAANSFEVLGWKPQTSLEQGLHETVNWYRRQLHEDSTLAQRFQETFV